MTPRKSSYPFVAQAETLLIYGIFLFLTGLAQICVTISHRYIIARNNHHNDNINILSFLPVTFTLVDMHLWYIYPSATLTIIPFVACVIYALFKRQSMAILICISSLISFISSSVYVGLLIAHTLEYWQTLASYRYKNTQSTTPLARLLVPFNEPSTYANLALLITFTLALVQALLSMIGAVISCIWSPCCMSLTPIYAPISTTSHYAQTTPHRHETPQSSTLRSVKRQQQQQQDTHRFITHNGHQDMMLNGCLHKNSTMRSHYDHV
ncbi:unnamed protein product [Rotaria socialis]|uniref:Uncharacterized protein n=1 Tax=Rotaria socialis TaxID=392032 RepID=A0A817X3E0_9BILA|nr:unnamed protein product [Rotaria socialis]CAF3212371.1 unnamed protein product [Rotaria socialis]CAF3363693.1 unnamed protein product [Rotaria socialis]CAF3379640.1 unnamed protein product [Rotaria socialis]CAF3514231.1 unnamed protein product [Rotaria socialis]